MIRDFRLPAPSINDFERDKMEVQMRFDRRVTILAAERIIESLFQKQASQVKVH